MKILLLTGASLLIGSMSYAAKLHCEGTYFFHKITADATVTGNQIVGDIVVKVNGGSTYTGVMHATASDVQEGRYIHATGEGKDGSGQLSADYNADSRTYDGELNASTSMGNANVDVSCTMTGSANPAFDITPEEARAQGLYPVQNELEFY
ncbi:MAG TPA: hypothetical protein VF412_18740 [Bdellovibrio sp.]|uniref:hypothetical protein n=1 Tax=Bdellovibrio sp. TaxID=28201 RepID=UPI002F0686F6